MSGGIIQESPPCLFWPLRGSIRVYSCSNIVVGFEKGVGLGAIVKAVTPQIIKSVENRRTLISSSSSSNGRAAGRKGIIAKF